MKFVHAHKNKIVKVQLWYKDKAGAEKIKRGGLKHLSQKEGKSDGGKTKAD